MPRQSPVLAAAGIGMSMIFGLSFLFTAQALTAISPLDLLGWRFALAAAAMLLLALARVIRVKLGEGRWLRLLPLACVQPVLYFICETAGIKLTSASEAGIIIGAIPVAVTIMAAVLLKERTGLAQVFFIVAATGGAIAVGYRPGGGVSHLQGVLLLFGAVLSACFYTLLSRRLSREFTPVEITVAMMFAGALAFNLLALGQHWLAGTSVPFAALGDARVWTALLYLGLLSSVAAFFLVNFMLSRMTAAQTTTYTNLTSLTAILAGVLVKGEPFHPYQWGGGLLVLLGVWGAGRFRRKDGAAAVASDEMERF